MIVTVKKGMPQAKIAIGSAGIDYTLASEGYSSTLCVPVVNENGYVECVDIHLTEDHMDQLLNQLQNRKDIK